MDKADPLSQARQNLADYLRLNSLRNTPERNALLEVIYQADAPLQAEELSDLMTQGAARLRISRATVYNNLKLFEEAGLVRKVFQDDRVFFERTDKNKGVIRLICSGCGKTTEMNSDKVRRQIAVMRTRRFNANGWVLNVYGLCGKCSADLKRKQNRLNKKDKDRK
ncbi:MAG: transcriptional repressor [Bacteroidaceae bacterium]|nr:transcriptional repressor [Bacteroidaceae bacterium]MBR5158197.1 transcriptional repressor [Bacteroidaceae bacterium]